MISTAIASPVFRTYWVPLPCWVGKVELARRLNGSEAKVHVVETEGVLRRLKILFGGEALFFFHGLEVAFF